MTRSPIDWNRHHHADCAALSRFSLQPTSQQESANAKSSEDVQPVGGQKITDVEHEQRDVG